MYMKKEIVASLLVSMILTACGDNLLDKAEISSEETTLSEYEEVDNDNAESADVTVVEEKEDAAQPENNPDASEQEISEGIAEDATEEEGDSYLPSESGYQSAYIDIIQAGQVTPEQIEDENYDFSSVMDSYIIYDIDKDSIPELLVRYGDCEAAYWGKLYTYKDGSTKLIIDEEPLGHTSFYSVPGENGILNYWGHMGYAWCSKMSIVDGEVKSEDLYEEDINEKIQNGEDAWYKDASEIAEGATYLEFYNINNTYPIEKYDLVEKLMSGDATSGVTTYSFPDGNENIYTELMDNNGTVTAMAMDQFMNSPGKVPFNRLLEEGVIYPYAHSGLQIVDIGYADFNLDGIYECYFYFSEPEFDPNRHSFRGILSRQDGEFYVYLAFASDETEITEDGILKTDNDEYYTHTKKRVIFDKEKSFEFYVQ